jgi:hypothetical protein
MQLYFWLVTVMATAAVLIGVFASFIQVQNKMGLGQPWSVPRPLPRHTHKHTSDFRPGCSPTA